MNEEPAQPFVKNFRISRTARDRDSDTDPFMNLAFSPPRGSSELFRALRDAYPAIPTHQGRMGQAVIDFYHDELQEERELAALGIKDASNANASLLEAALSSPSVISPSFYDESSPSSLDYSSESSSIRLPGSSPGEVDKTLVVAAVEGKGTRKRASMDSMMNSFRITLPGKPKVRNRRPMTAQEKAHYRQIRENGGACDRCKKRKRKCYCNLAESTPSDSVKRKKTKNTSPEVEETSPSVIYTLNEASSTETLSVGPTSLTDLLEGDMGLSNSPETALAPEVQLTPNYLAIPTTNVQEEIETGDDMLRFTAQSSLMDNFVFTSDAPPLPASSQPILETSIPTTSVNQDGFQLNKPTVCWGWDHDRKQMYFCYAYTCQGPEGEKVIPGERIYADRFVTADQMAGQIFRPENLSSLQTGESTVTTLSQPRTPSFQGSNTDFATTETPITWDMSYSRRAMIDHNNGMSARWGSALRDIAVQEHSEHATPQPAPEGHAERIRTALRWVNDRFSALPASAASTASAESPYTSSSQTPESIQSQQQQQYQSQGDAHLGGQHDSSSSGSSRVSSSGSSTTSFEQSSVFVDTDRSGAFLNSLWSNGIMEQSRILFACQWLFLFSFTSSLSPFRPEQTPKYRRVFESITDVSRACSKSLASSIRRACARSRRFWVRDQSCLRVRLRSLA